MLREIVGNGWRVRAWLLGKAEDPEQAATQLYDELRYEGGDGYVVVRADAVNPVYADDITQYFDGDECAHNIVVPVDAASETDLQQAIERIEGLGLVEELAVLRVTMPVPHPPHIANGYISHAELAAQHEQGIDIGEYIKAGRQGASPGHNAWG